MADQKQHRISLTRYRVGYTAKEIAPAWVAFLSPSPGAAEVITRGGFTRSVSARLRAGRGADIWPGDLLVLSLLGGEVARRVLHVEQVDHQGGRLLAMCVEYARPIPDEFTDTSYAGYWTDIWGGGPDVVEGTSQLQLTMPAATNAGSSHGLYQDVAGDFDCWTIVSVPAGGAGVSSRGLLGARCSDNGGGAWVGIKNDGSAAAARIDQTSSSTQTETVGSGSSAVKSVRLRREGTVFRTFWSAEAEPDADADWTEIAIPASGYFTVAPTVSLQVGLGGYRESGSSGAVLKFEWLRNWRAAGA